MATKPPKPTEALTLIEPSDSKEFRKANNVVSVRVKSGPTLSLMGRRLFNVLLYQAQTLGAPGVNAPAPWGGCPNPEDYYWIPLPDVVHDSAWGSKDHKLVISTLQQLQTTLVESDDPAGHFTSVQLIGTVHLLKGSGRRPSQVGWEFPRSTRDILSNPDFYTKLSIFHLTSLQTAGGAALYEIAKRYLTNIGGKTNKNPWHWWHDTLTGKQMGSIAYPEYKYFKRDVLLPALEEVNRTDINVELCEVKTGRTVSHLQFIVSLAQQTSLELPPGPVIDSVLLERVCAIGFTERQACELLGATSDAYLRATLELVEERINDKSMEPVKAPAAFFRKALKDDYVSTTKVKAKPNAKPAVRRGPIPGQGRVVVATDAESRAAAERKARVESALVNFEALPELEKTNVIGEFHLASATHKRMKPGGVMFQKTLGNWLVDNEDKPAPSMIG
jgi:hypothetical protein